MAHTHTGLFRPSLGISCSAIVLLLSSASPAAAACPPCPAGSDTETCVFNCCLAMTCSSPAGPGCIAFCALGKILTDVFDDDEGFALMFDTGVSPFDPDDPSCALQQGAGVLTGLGNGPVELVAGFYNVGSKSFDEVWADRPDKVSFFYKPLTDFSRDAVNGWTRIGAASFDSAKPARYVVRWDRTGVPVDQDIVVMVQGKRGHGPAPKDVRFGRNLLRAYIVAVAERTP